MNLHLTFHADRTIAEEEANSSIDIGETIQELRSKLEAQYAAKKDVQQKEIDELRQELERKNEELHKISRYGIHNISTNLSSWLKRLLTSKFVTALLRNLNASRKICR